MGGKAEDGSPLREQRDSAETSPAAPAAGYESAGYVAKSKLPRLPRVAYQGRAVVFWTHTLEKRARGYLDERLHAAFRELLVHACAHYELSCPAYVLMPDNMHLVWLGLTDGCDQTLATRFLRQHLAPMLRPDKLQHRPHDHVLREHERQRGAFEGTVHYIRENPVRAGLVAEWREWPFSGAVIAGYPRIDPREEMFWPDFWKLHNRRVEELAGRNPAPPGAGYEGRAGEP